MQGALTITLPGVKFHCTFYYVPGPSHGGYPPWDFSYTIEGDNPNRYAFFPKPEPTYLGGTACGVFINIISF